MPFESRVSLLAVCAYCRSLVARKDLDVSLLGKAALLQEDGSVIQLHARGTYEGRGFTVAGRVQMRFPEGFWNEWYLLFDDERQGWLGEAQGVYGVSFKAETKDALPPYARLAAGDPVRLDGEEYEVRDAREAEYVSAQGELPFKPPLGEKAPLADLSAPGGRLATIDYSEGEPILFKGRYVDFDSLKLSGLKAVEGW